MGQNYWDWTKNGARLKKLLESGIIKWLQTRADAEIRVEVAALAKFFFRLFVVLFLMMLVLTNLPFKDVPVIGQIIVSLAIVWMISLVGCSSLWWTFDHRASIRHFIGIPTFFILSTMMIVTTLTARQILEQVATNFWQANGFGIPPEPILHALVTMIIVSVFMLYFLFGYIVNWIFLGSVSFLIVGLLYVISLLSRFLVKKMTRQGALLLVFLVYGLVRFIKPLL
jgi:hypothetical protein